MRLMIHWREENQALALINFVSRQAQTIARPKCYEKLLHHREGVVNDHWPTR